MVIDRVPSWDDKDWSETRIMIIWLMVWNLFCSKNGNGMMISIFLQPYDSLLVDGCCFNDEDIFFSLGILNQLKRRWISRNSCARCDRSTSSFLGGGGSVDDDKLLWYTPWLP